ncbi:hypothetical protein EUGRSUZ_D00114 [Eucalyptus grandis]|uniref:Uncharacterized protein n=2 Tax=Eucalyptus grandis TaxID=71139 RepID=A0ACC3L237_EUCGR|nr:hypothetical protein EUGRSUZ_D00114 [Eucalyptus grandis]
MESISSRAGRISISLLESEDVDFMTSPISSASLFLFPFSTTCPNPNPNRKAQVTFDSSQSPTNSKETQQNSTI